MSEQDQQDQSVSEAEWHLAATEYRVYLAMRQRAQGDDTVGPEDLSQLFDDLVRALAEHRAALAGETARSALDRGPGPASGSPHRTDRGPMSAPDQ